MGNNLGSKISETVASITQNTKQGITEEFGKGLKSATSQLNPFSSQQQQADKKIDELKKEDETKKAEEIPEIEKKLQEEENVMKSRKIVMEHHEAAQRLGQPQGAPQEQPAGPEIPPSKEISPLDQNLTQEQKLQEIPLSVRQAETKIETGRGNKG